MNKLDTGDISFQLPQKKLFSSLLQKSEVNSSLRSSEQVPVSNNKKIATPAPVAPKADMPQKKPTSSPQKPPAQKIVASSLSPKTSPKLPPPRKETANLAFSQMEKLVSSIDPGMKIYSEDLKIERKKIFIAFESADFYVRLKGAIETHIGKVTEGKLKDLPLGKSSFDLYLLSHEVFTSDEAKPLFENVFLADTPAFASGTFHGRPVIVLKKTSIYDDKELKKALWVHLKAQAL